MVEQSSLHKRMMDGEGGPVSNEDWQEIAQVLTSLSRAMTVVMQELDAIEEVIELHNKVLEKAGFDMEQEDERADDLKALIEAVKEGQ